MNWIKTSYIVFLILAHPNFNLYFPFQGNMIYGKLFRDFQVYQVHWRVGASAIFPWYLDIFQLKQSHRLSWFLYDNIGNQSYLSRHTLNCSLSFYVFARALPLFLFEYALWRALQIIWIFARVLWTLASLLSQSFHDSADLDADDTTCRLARAPEKDLTSARGVWWLGLWCSPEEQRVLWWVEIFLHCR